MSEQPLTDRELRYLSVAWKYVMRGWNLDGEDVCLECRASAPSKTAVVHAIGCVFHNLPRDVVAAISADWTPA